MNKITSDVIFSIVLLLIVLLILLLTVSLLNWFTRLVSFGVAFNPLVPDVD